MKQSPNSLPPRLLVVGPLPPPADGTSVSFQLFCRIIEECPVLGQLDIIDSSPKRLKDDKTRRFGPADIAQALRVLRPYRRQVRQADQVLIFGSNGFLLMMAPILLVLAKMAGKPCFIRAFGGSLDQFYRKLKPGLQGLLRLTLQNADGLMVQTELLRQFFIPLLADRVHLIPGYRAMPAQDYRITPTAAHPNRSLRLVFVGHVREEKGVFVLLESLRKSTPPGYQDIHCDLYGPIYEAAADQLEIKLDQTPNATYKGVLPPEQVIPTLARYDALVFPSFYQGEGHPGVLIEAMMAGIPVITTNFRAIPDLITDRVNGLLVNPQDPAAIAQAISRVYNNRTLLAEMGHQNWTARTRYDADRVVPQLLRLLGIPVQRQAEPDHLESTPTTYA